MGHTRGPGHKLVAVEDRNACVEVDRVDAAVVRIVVLEDIAGLDAGIVLVALLDELAHEVGEQPRVGRDSARDCHRFARWEMERPERVSALDRDSRRRHAAADVPAGVADIHQDLPDGLVGAGVLLLALQILQPEEIAGLGEEVVVLRQQVLDRRGLLGWRSRFCGHELPPLLSQMISCSSSLACQPGGT